MNPNTAGELIRYLEQHLSDSKKNSILNALTYRTRYITVVLEDIKHSQNISATLRTCDCLGIQDVHIIENQHEYKINPKVARGSTKWIDIHRYHSPGSNNTIDCIQKLKNDGYWIVSTSPSPGGEFTIDTLPMDKKKAFIFGNEKKGLSSQAVLASDANLSLPMFGFTRSYNISVSAAIALFTTVTRLHKSSIPWQLSPIEKLDLTLDWYRRTIYRSDLIEKTFFQNKYKKTTENVL